nr:uncharacterized protein LOC129274723 [Lytechinus pictus]
MVTDTTKLLLLAAIFSVILACLPSLGQCFVIYEDEVDDENENDGEWKRGYSRNNVVADPVLRSPVTYSSMSKYLQGLASRRFVRDPQMDKRQVNVGLRLVSLERLRNHLNTVADSRSRQKLRHNQNLMDRVGRRR